LSVDFAIIGGTGVYDPQQLDDAESIHVDTPFGAATAVVGTYHNRQIAFMPRHGSSHSVPPHKINYRANIYALKELGVGQVFATAAVGSLQTQYQPGSLVIIDDFLDFTKSRPNTFFETDAVVHVDLSDPYCHRLRHALLQTASQLKIEATSGGTLVCTEGPRFESPAEVQLFQSMGAAVVGMTSLPEVVLAKEAELCYATVCMVTNYGAGISQHPLTHEEVVQTMSENVDRIRALFFATIDSLDQDRPCRCKHAVGGQQPLTGLAQNVEGGA
jgi:5'-methylthioadenosine phosphorylase